MGRIPVVRGENGYPHRMTAVPTDHRLLAIYLNDHYALLRGALTRAERLTAADGHLPGGAVLREVAELLSDDAGALRSLITGLDLEVRGYKAVLTGVAERLGRFKPNGHLLTRSPLSRVVELDAMRTALQDDAAVWRVLRALAETDSRVQATDTDTRVGRAVQHAEVVEQLRIDAAVRALGGRQPSSAG